MLRTWGTTASLNDNTPSYSKWLTRSCCVTGLCISIKEPYGKAAHSIRRASPRAVCDWSRESGVRGTVIVWTVVQTARNLFSKLLNVGTSCEEWFSWTLFPSFGFILLLCLAFGARASEQPCCYNSVLSFIKGLCGIIWVQILGERVEEPMHVYVWLYMVKPETSATALHSKNCN